MKGQNQALRDQTKIIFDATKSVERSFIWIDTEPSLPFVYQNIRNFRLIDDQYFKFTFYNEGKTPAFPVYLNYILTVHGPDSLDLRSYIINSKIDTLELEFEPNVIQFHRFANLLETEFTQTLLINHPYGRVFKVDGILKTQTPYFYLHTYFLYKDVFGMFHDYYKVDKLHRKSKKDLAVYSPMITINSYEKNPISK
jgi:hypothetical protein